VRKQTGQLAGAPGSSDAKKERREGRGAGKTAIKKALKKPALPGKKECLGREREKPSSQKAASSGHTKKGSKRRCETKASPRKRTAHLTCSKNLREGEVGRPSENLFDQIFVCGGGGGCWGLLVCFVLGGGFSGNRRLGSCPEEKTLLTTYGT